MSARIIDGKAIAARVRGEVAEDVKAYVEERGSAPGLAVVLVGDRADSSAYVRGKERACEEAGILSETRRLPALVPQDELLGVVRELNADERVHGILVQLPLPDHIDEDTVVWSIDPAKDVDGLHPFNMGLLLAGKPRFVPATPLGVQRMLLEEGIDLSGAAVAVCGRSNIVGRPLAALLLNKVPDANATVTICHTGTKDLPQVTRKADVVIAAMGRPATVTADMIRPGATVIDVGINRVEDPSRKRGYRLVGDVAFDEVAEVAGAITPVPGGVGPMTIAMLLHNVLLAAKGQAQAGGPAAVWRRGLKRRV